MMGELLPLPVGYQIPDEYELNGGGVFRVKWDVANDPKKLAIAKMAGKEIREVDGLFEVKTLIPVTPAPVAPVRVFRDFDGNELLELAWLHTGQVVRRFFPREVVKDGRALVKVAGAAGFPAISSSAVEVEKWLFAVETVNELEIVTIARQLGWQPDGTFVTGPGEPYRVVPVWNGLERAVLAHSPSGTLEEWQAIAEKVRDLPSAQMALYAALAAPLLSPLDLLSFLLHFTGLSSRGKTTSVQLGQSVWASPRVDGGALGEWKGTRVALERRLSLVAGLPVVFDETANVSHPNIIRDMIYTIPQGQEKPRGSLDGMRSSPVWSTVVLSTGEASLLSYVREGGAAARVIEVAGAPFGAEGGRVAEEVRAGVESVYGVAGPAYVAAVRAGLADDGGLERLRARHRELTKWVVTDGALARRRAPYVAVLRLAAEVARTAGVLPFDPPEPAVWQELFTYADSRDDRPGDALEAVWRWITSNPGRILGKTWRDWDDPPPNGWAGVVRKKDGAVALNQEEVARICEAAGFDVDAVKGAWAENGAILRDGKDLCPKTRIGPKSSVPAVRRFVFVKPAED